MEAYYERILGKWLYLDCRDLTELGNGGVCFFLGELGLFKVFLIGRDWDAAHFGFASEPELNAVVLLVEHRYQFREDKELLEFDELVFKHPDFDAADIALSILDFKQGGIHPLTRRLPQHFFHHKANECEPGKHQAVIFYWTE